MSPLLTAPLFDTRHATIRDLVPIIIGTLATGGVCVPCEEETVLHRMHPPTWKHATK